MVGSVGRVSRLALVTLGSLLTLKLPNSAKTELVVTTRRLLQMVLG